MSLRCDCCGKFAHLLHDVATNPSEGGIDREECCLCRHPGIHCLSEPRYMETLDEAERRGD